jgi:hypothetical protein
MSRPANVLRGERAALAATAEEGRRRIEEANEKVDDLRTEASGSDVRS